MFVLPLLYHRKALHNHNARGIIIHLHAHQLHNNNCWGFNCVIIPAPMVFLHRNHLFLGPLLCRLMFLWSLVRVDACGCRAHLAL